MMRLLVFSAALLLAACGSKRDEVRDFSAVEVTMPSGQVVLAERVSNPMDMARGLMFRDSLPKNRGLLYVWAKAGPYSAWMYQVKIPLDAIWMDINHNVVEVKTNLPPCPSTSAKECPHFGGTQRAQYMLQVPAGSADQYNVRVGSSLAF